MPVSLLSGSPKKSKSRLLLYCVMRSTEKKGFPSSTDPTQGLEKDAEQNCRSAGCWMFLLSASLAGARTGWSIHGSVPFSCHWLGAPGCRCWLEPLCPCWGALRLDLTGPLPLGLPKHCRGMDLGCLLLSFLKIVSSVFLYS